MNEHEYTNRGLTRWTYRHGRLIRIEVWTGKWRTL